jgi:hypothetical protein
MDEFNLQSLAQLDKSRFSDYKSNLDFYDGSQWAEKSKNRQLVFNYAQISINKITSYMMKEINFACDAYLPGTCKLTESIPDEANKKIAQRAESVLYQVYNDNYLEQLDYETEIDAAVLGDGCYKVTWDVEEERIKVTAPDINGIYAWWIGDDLSKIWRVASRYQLSKEAVEMLYKRKIGKSTATVTELWTAKDFVLYLDNEILQKKPNPYGFIPFVIFPNLRRPKSFWGTSDILPLKEAQRELNRALSQLSRILEVSGNPIAVLEGVESAEDIRVQPGAVWTLPENTKAYLLDLLEGGGIRLHVDYIDLIYRCLHDASETPRAAYGGLERELSGTALEVEMQSIQQKVTRKRTIRTPAYNLRNRMILALHKQFKREDFSQVYPRIVWGTIMPQDKAKEAQNEQTLVQSGVHSRRTAMDQIGIRDPELEFDKWLEERKRILEMNQQFRLKPARSAERDKTTPEAESAIAADIERTGDIPA